MTFKYFENLKVNLFAYFFAFLFSDNIGILIFFRFKKLIYLF